MTTTTTTPYHPKPAAVVPDLLSFDCSWENETMAMTASTTTELSSSSSSSIEDQDNNIQVSISGVLFSLDPSTFDKLRQLPWQTPEQQQHDNTLRHNNHKDDDYEEDFTYFLSTSPELFDVLVHHVLFGTLPPWHSLTEHDMEELELMALSLDLQTLAKHLSMAPPPPPARRPRRLGRGALRRQASYPVHKASAIRSWAALKRWSSTGRLVVQQKIMDKKAAKTDNNNNNKHEPLQTRLSSVTRHLA